MHHALKRRRREPTSYTMYPETKEDLRLLSLAIDVPQSRIIESALQDRFAAMTPVERAEVERLRTALAVMHSSNSNG